MCGRYTLIRDKELQKRYDKPVIGGYAVNPRYNVAPKQDAPIVTNGGIEIMQWGLVPSWATDGSKFFINARAESVAEKPAFRNLLKSGRCIVPASGFYEWLNSAAGKQPYYFFVKNEPLISFAGLYAERVGAEGVIYKSFTIITTEPNELVSQIHDRMPVILNDEDEKTWLDSGVTEPERVLPLLDAYPANLMDSYAVGITVNSTKNDDASMIKPLPDHPQ